MNLLLPDERMAHFLVCLRAELVVKPGLMKYVDANVAHNSEVLLMDGTYKVLRVLRADNKAAYQGTERKGTGNRTGGEGSARKKTSGQTRADGSVGAVRSGNV